MAVFDSFTGIGVASGFKLQAKAPLDARLVVDTIADRDLLVTENGAYEGMVVYVKADHTLYKLDGTTVADWSAIGGDVAADLGQLEGRVDDIEAELAGQVEYTQEEKTKLAGVEAGANNYTHPAYTEKSSGLYKIAVDSTGHVSGTAAVAKADITGLGIPAQDTTYSAATSSAAGLMSAADKAKLDGIAAGANKTTVDAALSATSANPVQNKAVQAAIDALPTEEEVNQAISNAIDGLINGAPATYDTLKEIADYLETHEDEYTALVSTVGGKVDKVSGKGLSTNDYTTAEKTKLSGVATGAQVNVIESIKVNGVAQTVTSKAVDIDVPTGALAGKDKVAEADLDTALAAKINAADEGNHSHANKSVLDGITAAKTGNWDAAYTHSTASHAPSNAQANIIESVKVNGEAQAVVSKAVDIDIPVIYAQAAQPANLKAGDLWIQISE